MNSIVAFQQNKSMCVALSDYLDQKCSSICHDISKLLLSIETKKIDFLPIIQTVRGVVVKEAATENNMIGEAAIILYANIVAKTVINYDHTAEIEDILGNMSIFDAYKFLLTTNLVDNNLYISISLQWLIDYFGKKDTHRIDITRHRIEEYLVFSKSDEVNTALTNALERGNSHIREFCAEVIREKKLISARPNLLRQLSQENDLYAARSIIDAIVAIDYNRKEYHKKDLACITKWGSKLTIADENSFIKRHIEVAIATFASQSSGQHQ